MVDVSVNYTISNKDDGKLATFDWDIVKQTETTAWCSNEWSRYAKISKWDMQQKICSKETLEDGRCFSSHLENAAEYYKQYCTDRILWTIKTEEPTQISKID